LETHLGWAAGVMGFQAVTPVFDGAKEEEIWNALREANDTVKARRKELKENRIAPPPEELLVEMPDGGKIVITAENVTVDQERAREDPEIAAGDYVRLSIADNGIGMTEAVKQRAFEPFFTTKEIGRGSGLGLSMVYGFVKQSGGHISISSELGVGTTVKLYLPRAGAEQREESPSPTTRAALPASRGGHVVLVVEDRSDVRAVAVAQLNELGYSVFDAGSGREALELLDRERSIDLLFTDVVLPGGINGAALAAEALRRRPSLKVIYTSGYTDDATIHHGQLGQRLHFLGKPYQKQQLAEILRQTLEVT